MTGSILVPEYGTGFDEPDEGYMDHCQTKELMKAGYLLEGMVKGNYDLYKEMNKKWEGKKRKKLGEDFYGYCDKYADESIKKKFRNMVGWGGWYYRWCKGEYEVTGEPRVTASTLLRDIIRSRMAPAAHTSRRQVLPPTTDIRELRARETMRRVLGEEEFRRFTRHGFVSIDGKSGLRYQIFPGHGITNVFDGKEMVDRLCVVLRGQFCPTDSLMMRYLMILNDEAQFRSFAVKHNVLHYQPKPVDMDTPLTELLKQLKAA